jgi:hypothetical protein
MMIMLKIIEVVHRQTCREELLKNLVDLGYCTDGSGAKYEYNGVVIDVMANGEMPDEIDGIQVGKLQSLLDAKYRYSLQNNSEGQKHHDDLVRIGYEFPKPENKIDDFDLF